MEISRSTLRQALTTLVQSGHLVSRRGRSGGTFVAENPPLTHDEPPEPVLSEHARAVLDYRVTVETGKWPAGKKLRLATGATVLAAERATDDDIALLEGLTDEMGATEGARFKVYRRADVRFHIGVAEACHSPRLVAAMTEVQGQMTDLISRIAHPDEVLTRSNEQHMRLVELLLARDVAGAVQLMREHCAGTEHILAGLMPEAIDQ